MDYQIHPEISHQSNWATVGLQQNPSNTNGPRGRHNWASPILCDPMDCSLLGSSVCGILQARILEWVAMPSSRGSSWPRDQTCVSCIAGGFFTVWAIRKVQRGAFPYRKRFPFSIKSWSYHSEIIDEVYMSLVGQSLISRFVIRGLILWHVAYIVFSFLIYWKQAKQV